jgi:hypothetical protein
LTVIKTLTSLGPLKLEVVAHEFPSHKGETLHRFVERKTTGNVECVFFLFELGFASSVDVAFVGLASRFFLLLLRLFSVNPHGASNPSGRPSRDLPK